jgi:phage baseplate assembly protein W
MPATRATPPGGITGTRPPGSTGKPPPIQLLPSQEPAQPGYGQIGDLGANWRIKFADADGIQLNMVSFEVIDFGAIAYKEILQAVKTILATPLYSAALERLLGVDQTIVDLPIDRAAEATIAILDALYFWEPRVQVVDISFASDVISGHLICNLQLNIKNVIYGTERPYDRNNIFETPTRVDQTLPPMEVPVTGPPGPPGPAGPGVAIKSGITQLVNSQSYIDVVFDATQTNIDWDIVCSVVNTDDANPLNIWPGIVTAKARTGFRVQLNGVPDSNHYFCTGR